MMWEGLTAPARIEATSRITSCQWSATSLALSRPPITGANVGQVAAGAKA
jgi:hypothetical protein